MKIIEDRHGKNTTFIVSCRLSTDTDSNAPMTTSNLKKTMRIKKETLLTVQKKKKHKFASPLE